jgi:hypothetical protein
VDNLSDMTANADTTIAAFIKPFGECIQIWTDGRRSIAYMGIFPYLFHCSGDPNYDVVQFTNRAPLG